MPVVVEPSFKAFCTATRVAGDEDMLLRLLLLDELDKECE